MMGGMRRFNWDCVKVYVLKIYDFQIRNGTNISETKQIYCYFGKINSERSNPSLYRHILYCALNRLIYWTIMYSE